VHGESGCTFEPLQRSFVFVGRCTHGFGVVLLISSRDIETESSRQDGRCITRPLQLTWPSVASLLRGHAAERQSLGRQGQNLASL
jgi:hypothetical protein